MGVDVFPPPADGTSKGLYSVIASALAGGTSEPSWVAVDDGTDAWVLEASRRSADECARGVVAVSSEEALVKAQRFGIGGAMWLPPASLGALDAFASAASAEVPAVRGAAALELLTGASAVSVVTFTNRAFWRAQLGDRELADMLAELAVFLEVPVAILDWPALVVADRDRGAIVEAWEERVAASQGIRPALSVLHPVRVAKEVLADVCSALTAGSATVESSNPLPAQPVHELPHGRRVGWWGIDTSAASVVDEGWFAGPVDLTSAPGRWRLDGVEKSGIVEEVLGSDEVTGVEDVLAVRVPGWATRRLQPGSPSGLLVTRIAAAASRRGLPLWIPNVEPEGLRLVLGLPGTLWVDGPAVPN